MPGETLNLHDVIIPDRLGTAISKNWHEWNILRRNKIALWEEVRKYLFATDTTTTTNAQLPWNNKTTIPKLCQTRDNLTANYEAALFPKRHWFKWIADSEAADARDRRDSIQNYMYYAASSSHYKLEMKKCLADYVDYGNAFSLVEWIDETIELPGQPTKVGYVGPSIRRISPMDIVFNPTANNFYKTPKIIRSVTSFGEVKKLIEKETTVENKDAMIELFEYLKGVRRTIQNYASDFASVDEFYKVDGFTSYRAYLESDYVEILTFYGDIYDWENDELLENYQIMVVDRHKIISKKPNPSYFGHPPIFHVGWRIRQDNLWAMGPLDNLVGMQYRIDHVENLKADVFDLNAFPPVAVKGYVSDFNWGPMEKILLGDDGDVKLMSPPWNILTSNTEVNMYMQWMEEMAGSPKEAMGFRTPGEKTAYEVQRLENAASRIFNAKIVQFEEFFVEPNLNGMLESARRNINVSQIVSVFDDEFNIQTFMALSPQDITGAGRLKPIAARHFAERAELIQNLTNFSNSSIGQDPLVNIHISGQGLAKLFEDVLDIKDYEIVRPYVRVTEEADAKRLQNAAMEQVAMASQTPAGLTPDDVDPLKDNPANDPQGPGQASFQAPRLLPAQPNPAQALGRPQ